MSMIQAFLEGMLEKKGNSDDEEEEVPDDEQLNDMITRKEQEVLTFDGVTMHDHTHIQVL